METENDINKLHNECDSHWKTQALKCPVTNNVRDIYVT